MTPPEFLLASLGSCAAYYATEYLRARNIPAIGLTVTVTSEKGQKPARLTHFRIALSVPGLEDQLNQDGMLRAAKKLPDPQYAPPHSYDLCRARKQQCAAYDRLS